MSENKILINDRNWSIPRSLRNVAVQNDTNSNKVTIKTKRYCEGVDLSTLHLMLKLVSKGGRCDVLFSSDEINTLDDDIELTWTLTPPATSFDGILKVQLVAFNDTFKFQSDIGALNIIKTLDADPIIPNQLDFVEKFILDINEKMEVVTESIEIVQDVQEQINEMFSSISESKDAIQDLHDNVVSINEGLGSVLETVEGYKDETERNVQECQEIKASTEISYDIDEEGFRVGFKRADELAFTYTPSLKGAKGDTGSAGRDAKEVSFQKTETHIQWQRDGESWNDLVPLSELKGAKGDTGSAGATGATGRDGREIELQKTSTHIQWRYVGEGEWTNLVALSEITGSSGSIDTSNFYTKAETYNREEVDQKISDIELQKGDKGETGNGWLFGTADPRPTDGRDGDLYIQTTSYDIFKKKAGTWENAGNIKGEKGDTGATGRDGREIELQKGETHIQWKYKGDPSWTNLVALSDLVSSGGSSGNIEKQEVQFAATEGYTILNQKNYRIGDVLHVNFEVKPTDNSYMTQGNYYTVVNMPFSVDDTVLTCVGSNIGWFKVPSCSIAIDNTISVTAGKDSTTMRVSGTAIIK